MKLKDFFSQLNIFDQCQKYGVSLWQCPQFLFILMGLIVIGSSLTVYTIGSRYIDEPHMVAIIMLIVSAILFIITTSVVRSFERLAEANRMKSEFISIVSHQLRTPLSNFKWVIELLTSGRLGVIEEKQVEYFRILKENSNRMKELVSDLLIVSRIEAAKLSEKKEECSLGEIISDLIKEFQPFSAASNTEIIFKPEPNLPKITVNSLQIKLVVENFLDNAIRYIKGLGKIEVKLIKQGEQLYFEIQDNGVGIPKHDQRHIFQKFFRSENIMKYQTQGSGLGLYIARAIIEKAGGKIGFKSQEGIGSTFWFTLPIKN